MIRLDITELWPVLSVNAPAMQRFILDAYGADRVELANFPHARLYKGETLIGLMPRYEYPRIMEEGDRLYLELGDLESEEHHET